MMCGCCCRQGPCAYSMAWGGWRGGRCRFLVDDRCSVHDRIVEAQGSDYPMFGTGCSSTLFNEDRDRRLRERIMGSEETL